jgi:rod shape-determining protein MreC
LTSRRSVHLLLVLSLGHVLLISAQVQSQSGVPILEAAAFRAFAGAQHATSAVADSGRSFWSNYLGLRGAARENADLKRRVLELEGQVQEQQAQLVEIEALRHTLALQRGLSLRTLAARVIAGSPEPGSLFVTIDRGSADGVEANMAVIAAKGVVGRVVNTPAPHAAQVQLITGRRAALGARLERAGAGGIVTGGAAATAPLEFAYVANSVDVRPGDRVITSGQDRIYPPGLQIGVVESADRGTANETYARILVRPAVDFSHIDLVLVVLEMPAGAAGPAAGGRPGRGPGQ